MVYRSLGKQTVDRDECALWHDGMRGLKLCSQYVEPGEILCSYHRSIHSQVHTARLANCVSDAERELERRGLEHVNRGHRARFEERNRLRRGR